MHPTDRMLDGNLRYCTLTVQNFFPGDVKNFRSNAAICTTGKVSSQISQQKLVKQEFDSVVTMLTRKGSTGKYFGKNVMFLPRQTKPAD
ncbi:hypothetical protein Y032_0002g838 [Ancylostoma ceylanicum]|uniref:Uncharacterized protein n=1 Tax=Ancylostoma ceylanicum TaxID=53326 RepID=A0A016W3F7_9BILA|nr:hypothetical protein Y032_0002g838 [Ancylostoma ceylanicum]